MEFADGLHLLLLPQAQHLPGGADGWAPHRDALTRRFGTRMHLMMAPAYDGGDQARFAQLAGLASPSEPAAPWPAPRRGCTTAAAAAWAMC